MWPAGLGGDVAMLDGLLTGIIKRLHIDSYPDVYVCVASRSLLLYMPPTGSKEEREGQLGNWFEVVLPRANVCFCFALVESARMLHRRMVYSSDCRLSFKRFQPDSSKRKKPWAPHTRHAAGFMFGLALDRNGKIVEHDDEAEYSSLQITRNRLVRNSEKLRAKFDAAQSRLWGDESGNSVAEWDHEIFVRRELLDGLIVDSILEDYSFFKTGHNYIPPSIYSAITI